MWDLFHSIFPLISISNCRICPPTFPGCGSLGLWLHPHHVRKDFGKGKFEMEMKMNMSNDWWNMQRVRHPTTSKLPLHRRVCHNFSWGCGEKEKNTDEYEYFVVFCISYFYESEISRLWLAMAAGPGPVNQPSRSRSELPTSNYPSNWMLCLTLMMTLMNKQTKQTASAACESLSPPSSTHQHYAAPSASSPSPSRAWSRSVCLLSLLATWRRCLSTGKWKCLLLGRWKGARCGAAIAGATHKFYYHTQKLMIFHILYFEKKKVHNNCPLTRTSLAVCLSLFLPLCLFWVTLCWVAFKAYAGVPRSDMKW